MCTPYITTAQPGWYKVYDFDYLSQQSWGFQTYNHYNYLCVLFCCDSTDIASRNKIFKINEQGDVVWSSKVKLPDAAIDYLTYFTHDLIIAKDESVYYLSRSRVGSNNRISSFLNKFDKDGRLIWMKEYPFEQYDMASGYLGMTLSSDSLGIIFTSSTISPSNLFVLTHIDSSGSKVWRSNISLSTSTLSVSHVKPIVRMPDNSIRLAYDNYHSTETEDYFAKIDSTGHPIAFYTNPLTSKTRDLQLHPNGNLVYLSKEDTWSLTEVGGLRVQMLTPDFDPVWTYTYNDGEFPGPLNENCFVRTISIHPDGRILVSGNGGPQNMHLLCFSPEGQLLWKRKLFVIDLEPQFGFQVIDNAKWGADGSIWVDGYIRSDFSPQKTKVFLIKLDSLGCMQPGCSSTLLTSPTEEVVVSLKGKCWKLSPNPANTEIVLSAQVGCGGSENLDRITVFDHLGHTIASTRLKSAAPYTIDCATWPSGMYYVQANVNGMVQVMEKVIVAH